MVSGGDSLVFVLRGNVSMKIISGMRSRFNQVWTPVETEQAKENAFAFEQNFGRSVLKRFKELSQ